MRVLGVNAIFHDPAAAIVVDGKTVAAAEEERFSRRKSRKKPVPFSNWELPELSATWCLREAGLTASDLDAVAYSYDPALCPPADGDLASSPWDNSPWEALRTLYAEHAEEFLSRALPGLPESVVSYVPHHVAHAASGYLCAPFDSCAVLVLDGRGEATSHLAGRAADAKLDVLATQRLPHSLGLLYERLTEHLGFRRSADEYKVMGLAAYGQPTALGAFRDLVRADGDGGFTVEPVDWHSFASRRRSGEEITDQHADLACSVQRRLEEVMLDLARWLHDATGERNLVFAGGVAFNCVANSRLSAEGPFDHVWVQPAAGDAGTALGSALYVASGAGDECAPMVTAALGRQWSDDELAAVLRTANLAHERPADLAEAVADALARNEVVGWFSGRSEFGPRALGHRSLLASPVHPENTQLLNDIKGREQFRPLAPMVLAERAAEIFDYGPLPSPYMIFTHRVKPQWRDRIPAVVHVDGTSRIQTVDSAQEPAIARVLAAFERRTGVPVVMNTSFNTADRPMVDSPADALECFGSAPIDVLALGPFLLRRSGCR